MISDSIIKANIQLDHLLTKAFSLARFEKTKNKPIKYLVKYHQNHKYLFMTYHPKTMKSMGTIIATHNEQPLEETYNSYYKLLLVLFENPSLKNRRINVLTHIYGYFKNDLTNLEKKEYFDAQENYLEDKVPYSFLLQLLKEYSIRFKQEYLLGQIIFEPYPKQCQIQFNNEK